MIPGELSLCTDATPSFLRSALMDALTRKETVVSCCGRHAVLSLTAIGFDDSQSSPSFLLQCNSCNCLRCWAIRDCRSVGLGRTNAAMRQRHGPRGGGAGGRTDGPDGRSGRTVRTDGRTVRTDGRTNAATRHGPRPVRQCSERERAPVAQSCPSQSQDDCMIFLMYWGIWPLQSPSHHRFSPPPEVEELAPLLIPRHEHASSSPHKLTGADMVHSRQEMSVSMLGRGRR